MLNKKPNDRRNMLNLNKKREIIKSKISYRKQSERLNIQEGF